MEAAPVTKEAPVEAGTEQQRRQTTGQKVLSKTFFGDFKLSIWVGNGCYFMK